jgi:hypothetical protein
MASDKKEAADLPSRGISQLLLRTGGWGESAQPILNVLLEAYMPILYRYSMMAPTPTQGFMTSDSFSMILMWVLISPILTVLLEAYMPILSYS